MKAGFLVVLLLCSAVAPWVSAQSFVINVLDGPGEGFNDGTPRVSDIDGQLTTLGQDRLDCLAAAAQVWADYLDITVAIELDASFDSLGGDAQSAVLGAAGPNSASFNFSGAPVSNMYFTIAEAIQFAGTDFYPQSEIDTFYNSDVDGAVVLGSLTWYYGTDGNPPGNKIDFFSTAMHEIGHGLGFLSLMDDESGTLTAGVMDIYTNQLRQTGAVNLDYAQMSSGQRAAANVSGQVYWKGANVVAENGGLQPIYAPNPLEPGSSISHWDESSTPDLLMEPFANFSFTGLTLERQAFADLYWPIGDAPPLDPDNVYVDFAFTGVETGAEPNPFDTLDEAVTAANANATIHIEPGLSSEIFSGGSAIGKPLTLRNNNPAGGSVTIGN